MANTEIEQRVTDALTSHPELKFEAIHVTVDGGRAVLDGTVDCARDATLAKKVAIATDGIWAVESRLRVVKPEPAA